MSIATKGMTKSDRVCPSRNATRAKGQWFIFDERKKHSSPCMLCSNSRAKNTWMQIWIPQMCRTRGYSILIYNQTQIEFIFKVLQLLHVKLIVAGYHKNCAIRRTVRNDIKQTWLYSRNFFMQFNHKINYNT